MGHCTVSPTRKSGGKPQTSSMAGRWSGLHAIATTDAPGEGEGEECSAPSNKVLSVGGEGLGTLFDATERTGFAAVPLRAVVRVVWRLLVVSTNSISQPGAAASSKKLQGESSASQV